MTVFAEEDEQSQSVIVIDHPLAPDTTNLATMSEVDNHVGGRDSQNNSIQPMHNSLPPASCNSVKEPAGKAGGHGNCLLLSDHDRIRMFIQEFLTRGLLPWAERTLRTLNEQVSQEHSLVLGLHLQRKILASGICGTLTIT